MFNATFNNISVISWQSVLSVDETEYQVEITDLSQVNDKLYHMLSLLQMGLIHALTYTSTLTVRGG